MPEIVCQSCDFEWSEESDRLARVVRDLHMLYNGHNVEVER